MFLASALNRGSHPPEILKKATNTEGKYFCLGHWLTTWRLWRITDECWRISDESPYAFLTEHFSLCSFYMHFGTDEDPSLRIESSAIINLRGVSTKPNKYTIFAMQTYKELNKTLIPHAIVGKTLFISPYRLLKVLIIWTMSFAMVRLAAARTYKARLKDWSFPYVRKTYNNTTPHGNFKH